MADPILKLFGVGKDLITSQMSQERGTQSISTTISDGQLVTANLVNGETAVSHSLGRVPRGFIVVAKDLNKDVWGNTFTAQSLSVSSNDVCAVTLWVF